MAARAPKIAKQLNISLSRIEDFLNSKGYDIQIKPTTKINEEQYNLLLQEFSQDVSDKVNIKEAIDLKRKERESVVSDLNEVEKVTEEKKKEESKEENKEEEKEEKVEQMVMENVRKSQLRYLRVVR